MPDREKVVRAVETCFDSWIDKHRNMGLDFHKVEQMKRDALELLKEQEAVKPKYDKDAPYVCEEFRCGVCDQFIRYRQPYCGNCGRKVKWND